MLKGHEGFVKGVAWDPLGKYLASQGDDAVVVWRCEDWQQVARITDAMHGTSMNFHCRCGGRGGWGWGGWGSWGSSGAAGVAPGASGALLLHHHPPLATTSP